MLPPVDDIQRQASRYLTSVTVVKDTLKNRLLGQARRMQFVADWLDDQAATRQVRELREKYAPLVATAEQDKDWDERERLLSEWGHESDVVLHPVYQRHAERLTAKARKYGITVPRQPSANSEESSDWYASKIYGFWLPSSELEQRLRREVRDEGRASYDEFRKWATLVFAVVGSVLAFVSVTTKYKQPDPCPTNYYRSDSGECLSGLQQAEKKVSALQVSSAPRIAKPSPARR
jgi:hypothetical protein